MRGIYWPCRRWSAQLSGISMTKNLVGQKFGRLEVLERIGVRKYPTYQRTIWLCRCECGVEREFSQGQLTPTGSRSCGCLIKEAENKRSTKHGKGGSITYSSWHNMKQRCNNKRNLSFRWYGAIGVKVCPRWEESFESFLADMGERPSPAHSIDRIDPTLGYAPGNCRWATSKQQSRNTRKAVPLEIGGKKMFAADWADQVGISRRLITRRLRRGWSPERAISRPA